MCVKEICCKGVLRTACPEEKKTQNQTSKGEDTHICHMGSFCVKPEASARHKTAVSSTSTDATALPATPGPRQEASQGAGGASTAAEGFSTAATTTAATLQSNSTNNESSAASGKPNGVIHQPLASSVHKHPKPIFRSVFDDSTSTGALSSPLRKATTLVSENSSRARKEATALREMVRPLLVAQTIAYEQTIGARRQVGAAVSSSPGRMMSQGSGTSSVRLPRRQFGSDNSGGIGSSPFLLDGTNSTNQNVAPSGGGLAAAQNQFGPQRLSLMSASDSLSTRSFELTAMDPKGSGSSRLGRGIGSQSSQVSSGRGSAVGRAKLSHGDMLGGGGGAPSDGAGGSLVAHNSSLSSSTALAVKMASGKSSLSSNGGVAAQSSASRLCEFTPIPPLTDGLQGVRGSAMDVGDDDDDDDYDGSKCNGGPAELLATHSPVHYDRSSFLLAMTSTQHDQTRQKSPISFDQTARPAAASSSTSLRMKSPPAAK